MFFFFQKIINGLLPVHLQSYISYCGEGPWTILYKTKIFESSFIPYCIKEWNDLSEELLKIKSTVQFKTKACSFIKFQKNSDKFR